MQFGVTNMIVLHICNLQLALYIVLFLFHFTVIFLYSIAQPRYINNPEQLYKLHFLNAMIIITNNNNDSNTKFLVRVVYLGIVM
jgi:hypothetical protein